MINWHRVLDLECYQVPRLFAIQSLRGLVFILLIMIRDEELVAFNSNTRLLLKIVSQKQWGQFEPCFHIKSAKVLIDILILFNLDLGEIQAWEVSITSFDDHVVNLPVASKAVHGSFSILRVDVQNQLLSLFFTTFHSISCS